MALTSTQIAVGAAATLIVNDDPDWQEVQVKNIGASAVFLGGSDVTTATGYKLDANETISARLNGAEKLYGIVASGTVTVSVLLKQVG